MRIISLNLYKKLEEISYTHKKKLENNKNFKTRKLV